MKVKTNEYGVEYESLELSDLLKIAEANPTEIYPLHSAYY